jgi:putative flippase GtrA
VAAMVAWTHIPRLMRFLVLGCSNTLISYSVFAALMYVDPFPAHIQAGLSQVFSYASGLAWAAVWSRRWAFRDGRSVTLVPQTARFLAVQLGCLVLSAALIGFAVDQFRLQPSTAWLAVMTLITALNYLALTLWVFPAPQASNTA